MSSFRIVRGLQSITVFNINILKYNTSENIIWQTWNKDNIFVGIYSFKNMHWQSIFSKTETKLNKIVFAIVKAGNFKLNKYHKQYRKSYIFSFGKER